MPVKIRPNPTIPDHEVLRKIGGGAYGEVWLARGVTGALRAVKVVWREDFEDERGFEREFEGILKFEPISRDHPALVNILHVGRSPDGSSFYYYVMEIGDDVRTGRDINPIEYEPRTLRADHHQGNGVQWETRECIDVGLRLAEALEHLHERGLAHRDVKPSNVIFVNGRAKLADIGLVAARGQRTFVGTEGFVPPEGPGSAQADVYSLGKVLYEIATGKDRMNFPELPDDMPTGGDRRRWLELNRIICDVCEPRISKRQISTAGQLAESLRRIQRGKRHRRSTMAVWLTTLMLTLFAGWAGWEVAKESDWVKSFQGPPPDPEPLVGQLRVFSTPEGADVYDESGVIINTTPTPTMTARIGEEVVFTLRKLGYHPLEIRAVMPPSAVREPMAISGQLKFFSPPVIGEAWVDHLGNPYQPVEDDHISSGFVSSADWKRFVESVRIPVDPSETLAFTQNGQPVEIALVSKSAAADFCRWMRAEGIDAGFLTENHEFRAQRELTFEHPELSDSARSGNLRPFRVLVREIEYGSLRVITNPPGADVYVNGQAAGSTHEPLTVPKLKPGEVDVLLVLEGYKPRVKKVVIQEGLIHEETITLEKNQGVVFGREWENSIQMNFAPLGQDLMVSIWETRVADYALFVNEAGHEPPPPTVFSQEPDHPVVNVSRYDARLFCEWLTRRERDGERIAQSHEYRLPTDLEWSRMAGLEEEEGISPGARDVRKPRIHPWGVGWPPPDRFGNFADATAARAPGVSRDRTIIGYNDGFVHTAPVGSFPPNKLGLFDLSGNVQEWVNDDFSMLAENDLGVLRGGGWNSYQAENLYTGSRNGVPPNYRDAIYGFRVVLAKIPPSSEEE
jgi:serine/threonine protein kinase